jgi:tetratricopeptide (TPR) repeat protein
MQHVWAMKPSDRTLKDFVPNILPSAIRSVIFGCETRCAVRHGPNSRKLIMLAVLALLHPMYRNVLWAQASASPHSAGRYELPRIHPDDAATREGFLSFYNTDYDAAVSSFEKAVAAHPEDPFAANHLLEAVLVRELDREGALEARLYMGTDFLHVEKPPVDNVTRARIHDLTARALSLSERILKKRPADVDALYTRGVTRSLSAIDLAFIDKAWFPALRTALGAYRDHRRVIQLSPGHSDAKLVVGVYLYILGALPFYERAVAFMFTLSGNKTKGMEYIRQAADAGGDASVDAKAAHMLFLARDHQYGQALEVARDLYRTYPHNFNFALAEAGLLRDSNNRPEAIASYHNLLALGQQGMFPHARLGRAAYDLGETLRSQRDYAAAAQAFESAARMFDTDRTPAARAALSAGQMYDLLQERASAIKKYEEVIALAGDSSADQEARRLLIKPYRLP